MKTPEGLTGLRHPGSSHFCEFYLQKVYHILTVNIREKTPHTSGRNGGNESYEVHQSILFFSTRFTLRTNQLTRVQPVYQLLSLCNPMDYNLPGSSVHGIFQGRILEWVAISSSRTYSQPRGRSQVSCIGGRFFTAELPGKSYGISLHPVRTRGIAIDT